jgi:hypothetical protein
MGILYRDEFISPVHELFIQFGTMENHFDIGGDGILRCTNLQ